MVECGYSDAAATLGDPGAIDRMGAAIARGVRSFLGGFGRAARGLVAPGSYIIPGPAIVPLQQPVNSNKCWATFYTMLYQWWNRIENQTLDICATAGSVGPRYANLCSSDSVLPWSEMEAFAAAAGLVPKPAASYPLDAWVDTLTSYGPIWISIHPNPASPTIGPTHALVRVAEDRAENRRTRRADIRVVPRVPARALASTHRPAMCSSTAVAGHPSPSACKVRTAGTWGLSTSPAHTFADAGSAWIRLGVVVV